MPFVCDCEHLLCNWLIAEKDGTTLFIVYGTICVCAEHSYKLLKFIIITSHCTAV